MEKFTKTNAEKYIRSTNDAQVAQLGHLNAVVENFNDALDTLSATVPPFLLYAHTGTIPAAAWKSLNSNPFVLKTFETGVFILPTALVYQPLGSVGLITSNIYVRTLIMRTGNSAFMYGSAFPGNQSALYFLNAPLSPDQPAYPNNSTSYNIILDADFDEPAAFVGDVPYCLYYYKVKTPQITPA